VTVLHVEALLRKKKGKGLTSNAGRARGQPRQNLPAAARSLSEPAPIDRYWISVGGTLTEVFADEPSALAAALHLKEMYQEMDIAIYDAIEHEHSPIVFKNVGTDGGS
jgi:hypothetical protein